MLFFISCGINLKKTGQKIVFGTFFTDNKIEVKISPHACSNEQRKSLTSRDVL
jgi:hypothetical protein